MVRAYAWTGCNFFYHRSFSQPSLKEVVYQRHASICEIAYGVLVGGESKTMEFFNSSLQKNTIAILWQSHTFSLQNNLKI